MQKYTRNDVSTDSRVPWPRASDTGHTVTKYIDDATLSKCPVLPLPVSAK